MQEDEKIKIVQDFIFKDDVQEIISKINDNLMDFNIFEITGMGNQEIKHSNILAWLFNDSEHNLEYHILDSFLKKVITENKKDNNCKEILEKLQSYIYLAKHKKDIVIYRENNNIDLLIVDEANKTVITIENKVYASERINGEDEGQLSKYEVIINNKYKSKLNDSSDGYDKYFIYLTLNLEKPLKGDEYWLKAKYQNITDVIDNIIIKKKNISIKTKIILESYVDLLKRNGIVEDKNIQKLCEEIWNKKEYKDALEIIMMNRPNKANDIEKYIESFQYAEIKEKKIYADVYNFFISFNKNSPLLFRFLYSYKSKFLGYLITSKEDINDIQKILNYDNKFKNKNGNGQFGYKDVTTYIRYCNEDEINEDKITQLLGDCLKIDNSYNDK